MKIDWEMMWASVAVIIALCFVGIIFKFLVADRQVRCFYPLSYPNSGVTMHTIYGDVDWGDDKRAFITMDSDEMFKAYERLTPHCPVK